MGEWRLVRDGQMEGRRNMAVDRALLMACEDPLSVPTLRLYGWSLPTVTVGHSQNIERDVDLERARGMGVDVVRRPTRGRAIWHSSEVTYSVVAPLGAPGLGHHLKDIFEAISRHLISGLIKLGVPEHSLAFQTGALRVAGRTRSPACFAELHFGEITVDGKKLVGSAQGRTRHAFLQHGSILIGEDFDRFTRVCRFENEDSRQEACRRLREGSTNLQEVLSAPVFFDEAVSALIEGFRDEPHHPLIPSALTARESTLRDAFLKGS